MVSYTQRGKTHDTAPRFWSVQFELVEGCNRRCLTGDTKVALLDGRNISLEQIHKEFGFDNHFWVYSITSNGRIVPGKAKSLGITKKVSNLIEIVLDNGESIICTEDHEWMLRSGDFKRADELKVNDSLMPLYRKMNDNGYEEVYSPYEDRYFQTHWLVNFRMNGKLPQGWCIHHGDFNEDTGFNKLNNSPDVLNKMSVGDHGKLHAKLGWSILFKNPEFMKRHIARSGKRLKNQWKDPKFREMRRLSSSNTMKKLNQDPKFRNKMNKISSKVMKKLHQDPEFAKRHAERSSINMSITNKKRWKDPDYRNKMCKIQSETLSRTHKDPEFAKRHAKRSRSRMIEMNKTGYPSHVRFHVNRGIKKEGCVHCFPNHKVKLIRLINRVEEVYDITVDEYHNFALSAGVFVHNCSFCGIHAIRKGVGHVYRQMDLDMLRNLCQSIAQIRNDPRCEIDNHGEPMLHDDPIKAVSIMREILTGASLQIQTNGEVLYKDGGLGGIVRMANKMFSAGLNMFVVDAYDIDIFEDLTGNIDLIRAALSKSHPDAIVVDYFHDNLNKLNMYHKNHGKIFFIVDDLVRVYQSSDRKAAKFINNEGGNTPNKVLEKLGIEIIRQPLPKACTRPFREITFGWNGIVAACCYDWKNACVMGKFPEMSVKEIWNSPAAHALRFLLAKHTKFRNMSPCDICNYNGGFRIGLLPKMEYSDGVEEAIRVLDETQQQKIVVDNQYPGYEYHVNGKVYNDATEKSLKEFLRIERLETSEANLSVHE